MDNQYMPWEDWEFVGDYVARHKWTYAKTMPQFPHYYTLRKDSDDDEFIRFVKLIREYGYRYKFSKTWYIQLNVNNWYYWTMGDTLDNTILVNRKERRLGIESPFDTVVDQYEAFFADELTVADYAKVNSFILNHSSGGRILEIGCGSGMTTRSIDIPTHRYLGIEPSWNMLEQFKSIRELGVMATVHTDFESFYTRDPFSLVYATYGSASYIRPEFWCRLSNLIEPGGIFFLMFFSPSYAPSVYELPEVMLPCFDVNDFPADQPFDTRVITKGNYDILVGVRKQ